MMWFKNFLTNLFVIIKYKKIAKIKDLLIFVIDTMNEDFIIKQSMLINSSDV